MPTATCGAGTGRGHLEKDLERIAANESVIFPTLPSRESRDCFRVHPPLGGRLRGACVGCLLTCAEEGGLTNVDRGEQSDRTPVGRGSMG